MKNRLKGWWLPMGVALVLILAVGSVVANSVLALNSNQILHQHNADLAKIKSLQQRLAKDENEVVGYAGYITQVFNVFCVEAQVSCPAPPSTRHLKAVP